jgi:biopolymer transport protein ExbD
MGFQKLKFVKGLDTADDSTVNVNVTPLIDMLVILVVFLVIAQTIIRLKTIDAGMTAGAGLAKADPQKELVTKARLFSDHTIELTSGQYIISIPSTNGGWNFSQLKSALEKSAPSASHSIELQAEEGIPYGELVQAMDALKTVSPKISLSIDSLNPDLRGSK